MVDRKKAITNSITTSISDIKRTPKTIVRAQSNNQSDDAILDEAALPSKLKRDISKIMNWRTPNNDTDCESDDEHTTDDNADEAVVQKGVVFEDEVKSTTSKKKSRRMKGRRSVRPISEREGGVSPKEQMKMGKSYASFFQRMDELDTEEEDDLNIRLCDGLRTWLKFGMNMTGNTEVF